MRKVNREAEEEGGGGERNAAGIGWQTRRQINDRKKVKNYFPQIQLAVMKMLAQTPRRKNRAKSYVLCRRWRKR